MPRRKREKSISRIYHIIWRGANRQEFFHDEEDCRVFLDIFQKYSIKFELSVYAWCLMNNHVHLLIKEGNEPISMTMKRIGISFVAYYNKKYRTCGHLFQDRFKSEAVENDTYFITVVRYIHQNPLKAGMVKHVQEWKWSSCLGYYGGKVYPENMLDRNRILHMFSKDEIIARARFKVFNEKANNDLCLDDDLVKTKLTDDEARQVMKELLGSVEIPQVKSLPRQQRNELLRKVKRLERVSQRQAARILGVSPNLIFKA